jgi:hypothetical protein
MARWTDAEVARLRRLKAKGYSSQEAAVVIGRGYRSVEAKCTRLWIESSSPRGPKSSVMTGRAAGGKVLVRMPKALHAKLAEVCSENRESITECLVRLIKNEIKGD